MKILSSLAAVVLCTSLATAANVREQEPSPDSKGKVYAWKSSDGLEYHYFVPRSYDPEKGAALTFVLHGSNLDKRWAFANHKAGDFRPDDIVVAPDGTTENGQGGYNFLGQDDDVGRFEILHKELMETFEINASYLYGHSQGSFFSLHYAGAKPELVDGVLAHASGAWAQTRMPKKAHGQAIVFMHGTQDPVVSYGQSEGSLEVYLKEGYEKVRLKSLEGWNHWPAEHNAPVPHASRQIAWIEGMTSEDPARVGAAFRALNESSDKEHRDFQALYMLSARILEMPSLGGKAEARAKEVMANIDALAKKHVAAMKLPDPDEIGTLVDEPWVGHLPMFLRNFRGVPAADELAGNWEKAIEKQKKAAIKHFADYREALGDNDQKDAFEAGAKALSEAFLRRSVSDKDFLQKLENWAGNRDLDIPKDALKAFKADLKIFRDAQEDGAKNFWAENKRARI